MGNILLPEANFNTTLSITRDQVTFFYFSGQQGTNIKDQYLGQIMSIIAIPVTSFLGIFCNILAARIARAHGLNKSYNILIFALAVGDGIFLAGVNNVVLIIYMRLGTFGLHYSETLSLFLYVCFHIQNTMDFYGRYLAMTLPMLITFERFVAVYFPLRLSSIITPHRTRVSVFLVAIAPLPIFVYFCILHQFGYLLDPATNTTAGYLLRSDYFIRHFEEFGIISKVFFMISGPLPNAVVLIGCITVGVKLKLVIKTRKQLFTRLIPDSEPTDTRRHTARPRDPRSSDAQTDEEPYKLHYDVKSRYTEDAAASPKVDLPESKGVHSRSRSGSARHRSDLGEVGKGSDPSNEDDRRDSRPNTHLQRVSARREANPPCTPTSDTPMPDTDKEKGMKYKANQIRTTLMLVSACVVYTLTVSFKNLPTLSFTAIGWESNTGYVIERCSTFGVCINSASNFLVYLIFNKRYRQTLRQLLLKGCRGKSSGRVG